MDGAWYHKAYVWAQLCTRQGYTRQWLKIMIAVIYGIKYHASSRSLNMPTLMIFMHLTEMTTKNVVGNKTIGIW